MSAFIERDKEAIWAIFWSAREPREETRWGPGMAEEQGEEEDG